MKKIGRLHVLTEILLQTRFSALEITEMALAGGADTIQYRQKTGATREMIRVATELKTLCRQTGVPFIVNDRLDVALASQADGVHLGQDDFPIPLARKILGSKAIIGGSASTLEEARKCLLDGADYIGFGPVFPTTSKDDAGPVSGLNLLAQVVREIPLPIIAIGGIISANTTSVIQTRAHGIAVISAVCCQEDPKEAVNILRRVLWCGLG
ncbi:MAG: thiamine phosphate synthase [Desulfobacca sp.]|nr:thiamine phosphate synthase [Desulfobacca sp.]